LTAVTFKVTHQSQLHILVDGTTELESKLPPTILEEIFKSKSTAGHWSTDELRTTLKEIVKRKEDIKSIRDIQKDLQPFTNKGEEQTKRVKRGQIGLDCC
jgi:hypothetical protein